VYFYELWGSSVAFSFGLVLSLKLQIICIASLIKLGEFNASDMMRLPMCMVVEFCIYTR